jgi:hypothetical protein
MSDKVYKEKVSGLEQNRSELISCLGYVRNRDSVVITKGVNLEK